MKKHLAEQLEFPFVNQVANVNTSPVEEFDCAYCNGAGTTYLQGLGGGFHELCKECDGTGKRGGGK